MTTFPVRIAEPVQNWFLVDRGYDETTPITAKHLLIEGHHFFFNEDDVVLMIYPASSDVFLLNEETYNAMYGEEEENEDMG